MGSNNKHRNLQLTIFLLFASVFSSFAQHGSIYFSAGYSMAWYGNSTIHINQSELGNSYDLYKVKANDNTGTAFSPLHLSYRLGYYFNEWQDLGLELSFDPFKYSIVDGTTVDQFGTINNILNTKSVTTFSKKGGAYYSYDGLNLMLVNLVKRWRIYRANSSKISVDALGRVGIGPAMPHFLSKLPVNPTESGVINWGGWNYGFEAGVRATLYRYVYVELTGKYDYAMLDGLPIYQGTASQNIATYAAIFSVGFTLPTSRRNPLFLKEKNIITMLPWFQHKDELGENAPAKVAENPIDSLGGPGIPEFGEIVNKNDPKYNFDSLAALDSVGAAERAFQDSVIRAAKKNKRKRNKGGEVTDSATVAPVLDSAAAAAAAEAPKVDSTVAPKVKKRKRKSKNETPVTEAVVAPVADTSAAPVTTPTPPPAAPPADTVKTEAAPASDTVKTDPPADPDQAPRKKRKKKK